MTRKEIQEGKIRIAYGHDEITGYFISVYDARLAVERHTSTDLDNACYAVSSNGTGSYFDAQTGKVGFGRQVTKDTMKVLWERYGASAEEIETIA